MTTSLSPEMLKEISNDMNVQKSMLTDEQVNAIATKANSAINLPIIGEQLELKVFAKVVKLIDMKLYEVLPNEYYQLINDSSNGINAQEAALMESRLTKVINEKVNIPIISEKKEGELISLVIGQIIKGLVSGTKLEETPLEN